MVTILTASRSIVWDFDGTITPDGGYSEDIPPPRPEIVALMRRAHDLGLKNVIASCRWSVHELNDAAGAERNMVAAQAYLEEWGIPYDELRMKPLGEVYVDDKACHANDLAGIESAIAKAKLALVMDENPQLEPLFKAMGFKASGDNHEWGCLMVDFPDDMAQKAMDWAQANVPDDVLYLDPEDPTGFGRETHIHTTVAYGLDPKMDRQKIADVVADISKPVKVRLGKISKFEPEDYDVIKVEVESDDLHALHDVVKALGVPGETYPDYKPHLTLAYVQKGSCDDLLGQSPFEGEEFELTSFDYSAPPEPGQKDKHTKYQVGTTVKAATATPVRQTETPEFEAWFAGSKVVDGMGQPLMVFHGTADHFNTFKTPSFFTADADAAESYARDERSGSSPNVKPVYLAIKNPARGPDIEKAVADLRLGLREDVTLRSPYEFVSPGQFQYAPQVIQKLESEGFDGAILDDFAMGGIEEITSYCAFHPGQIKSATGNRGTFDPEAEDITAGAEGPLPEGLKFYHGVNDAHGGEIFCTSTASIDDKVVAAIDWTEYQNEVRVNMVGVRPELRRRGIATALWQDFENHIKKDFPEATINRGLATDEGAQWLDSLKAGLTYEQGKDAVGQAVGESIGIAMMENPKWVCPTTKMERLIEEVMDKLTRWGAFEDYAKDNLGVPLRAHRVFATTIEFTDRYQALGIPYPDPETMCGGQCEGTGVIPVNFREPAPGDCYFVYSDEKDALYRPLWDAAEAECPSDDGYQFIKCPDCAGTGKIVATMGPNQFVKFWISPEGVYHEFSGDDEHADHLDLPGMDADFEPGDFKTGLRNALGAGWTRGGYGNRKLYFEIGSGKTVDWVLKNIPDEFLFCTEFQIETFEGEVGDVQVLEGEDASTAWTHRNDIRHRVPASLKVKASGYWITPKDKVIDVQVGETGEHGDALPKAFDAKTTAGRVQQAIEEGWVRIFVNDEEVNIDMKDPEDGVPRVLRILDGINELVSSQRTLLVDRADVPEIAIDEDETALQAWNHRHSIRKRVHAAKLSLPKGVAQNVKGFDGSLASVGSWKAKLVLGNNARKGQKKGDWDGVGYVMVNPDSGTIVPVAYGDEHQSGYDLLYHYQEKGFLNAKGFTPLTTRFNYLSMKDPKTLKVLKFWLDNGGPDGIVHDPDTRMQGRMSEWLAGNGQRQVEVGKLAAGGKSWVQALERFSKLWAQMPSNREPDEQVVDKLFDAAFDIQKTARDWHFMWGSPGDALSKLFTARDVQGLGNLILGMSGVKNEVHSKLKHLIDNPKSYEINDFKSFFGDLELAKSELDRIGSIKASIIAHIVKRGSKWVVTNKSKTKTLGTHDSKESAQKQLAAIEIAKHAHGSLTLEAENKFDQLYKEAVDVSQNDAKYSGALENPSLAQEMGQFQQAVKDSRSEDELQQAWSRFQPSVTWEALTALAGHETQEPTTV